MSEKTDESLASELKALSCTNLRLRQLMRRVARHYDREMASVGLKTTQYSLLTHVLRLGPVRPGALAQSIKVSASTLTRNLKPLVDAGWVTLSAGSDARSRCVAITPAGRAKREEARHRWKTAQNGLNQILGGSRVLALHELINESLALLAGDDTPEDDD
jgi:DNA-binding MarR family transcriptional regulator